MPVVLPVAVPVVPAVAANEKQSVLKSELIDLSGFTVPMIGADIKHRLLIRCPQIPKSGLIEVPVPEAVSSFLQLSEQIVKSLGLPS